MNIAEKKTLVAAYHAFFQDLMCKPIRLQWDKHDYPMVLQDIVLAVQKDIANLPEKRMVETGKMLTPVVLQFQFEDDYTLDIVADDITDVIHTMAGITLTVGAYSYGFLYSEN